MLVDQARVSIQGGVDVDYFPGQWREQLRHGLHGFNGAEHIHLGDFRANVGQVDVHDVSQLALSVIRDAYGNDPVAL